MQKYLKSKEAQDIVGKQIIDYDFKQATFIKNQYSSLPMNINKIAYLNHFLGPGNTKKYIDFYLQGGIDYADKEIKKIIGEQGKPVSALLSDFSQRMGSYK